MGCKCTCGNCCSHGKDAKEQQKTQQANKNAEMLRQREKRKHRNQAAFYKPK